MSQILTRRRSRQLNCSSDVTSGVGSVCETSVKVGEGNGSDLFISDDDDVVDRDYVQPAHMSSSDDESLPTRKEQRKKHKAMSLLQPCVSRLSDPELSDGTGRTPARGSRVFAVTRIALESDSSYHTQVKKQRKSYNSKGKQVMHKIKLMKIN
ncbi:hypothetical protein E2C01_022015 [Portunus trituberculatus]|uniref:Uncharacterized protein n=1 Tax=Portunus trituberculatus TaxID=210409 RepID=A0A5B7E7S9_PORTR|nr:hypothetical protein [Portunus trituberculatus]